MGNYMKMVSRLHFYIASAIVGWGVFAFFQTKNPVLYGTLWIWAGVIVACAIIGKKNPLPIHMSLAVISIIGYIIACFAWPIFNDFPHKPFFIITLSLLFGAALDAKIWVHRHDYGRNLVDPPNKYTNEL